ncbi:hypothetical protein [Actinomadura oligospora]|uniref:hypothetical protein n=1 Tax=Actinomadura oligospora TaxID=111804 RepID=UPI000478FF24|nr:hypothetical protein [Actinomadura oligospora]
MEPNDELPEFPPAPPFPPPSSPRFAPDPPLPPPLTDLSPEEPTGRADVRIVRAPEPAAVDAPAPVTPVASGPVAVDASGGDRGGRDAARAARGPLA